MNQNFLEKCQVGSVFVPISMDASSGPVSVRVSMENYGRMAFILHAGAGTAANDTTITFTQSVGAAGSPKALNLAKGYVKQGAALSAIAAFTEVDLTAGAYTSGTSGEDQLLWVFDVLAEDLDIDGGYDHIIATVNDHGAAKVGGLLAIGHEPKYAGAPASMKSLLAGA